MRAEEGRRQGLLSRITSQPQRLTGAAAQVGELAKGPWWHVDDEVGRRHSQTLRRISRIVGAD